MGSPALKVKNKSSLENKRMSLKEKFGNPHFVLEQMAQFVKDGDVASITDLIASYVANSKKYDSQEEFASAIGTTRQTLSRMFAHSEAVSLKVFFGAIEKIHEDSKKR